MPSENGSPFDGCVTESPVIARFSDALTEALGKAFIAQNAWPFFMADGEYEAKVEASKAGEAVEAPRNADIEVRFDYHEWHLIGMTVYIIRSESGAAVCARHFDIDDDTFKGSDLHWCQVKYDWDPLEIMFDEAAYEDEEDEDD